jgi:hypothetical protein
MKKQLFLIFIFTSLIILLNNSCEKCREPWYNSLSINFIDSTYLSIFQNENYSKDSVKLYNITDSVFSRTGWFDDTSVIFLLEENFYTYGGTIDGNYLYNKTSEKEFYIQFNQNDADTFKCELKINIDNECDYHELEYAKLFYNEDTFNFYELQKDVFGFTIVKDIKK